MKTKTRTLKCIRIDAPFYDLGGTISNREVAAWVDNRYPALAIQETCDLESPGAWDVAQVNSGQLIARLPSKAAAQAALEPLSKLLDWHQPAWAIVPANPGELRFLRTSIMAIVAQISRQFA